MCRGGGDRQGGGHERFVRDCRMSGERSTMSLKCKVIGADYVTGIVGQMGAFVTGIADHRCL